MAERVYRVGVLAPEGMRAIASFRERLRQLGWIEGRNIRFDYRSTGGDDTRQPALAAELVALPVDLILTWGTPATLAAKQATATIPIVIGAIGDPVAVGVVPNLAHPGGNVTGFASQSFELEDKRFELLRELVPGMARVVMLGNVGNLYADLAIEAHRSPGRRGRAEVRRCQNRCGEWSRKRPRCGAPSRIPTGSWWQPSRPSITLACTGRWSHSWRPIGSRRSIATANSSRPEA
mgnify:CR=1 FL=1